MIDFTPAARANIAETGIDPADDVVALRAGWHTRKSLLMHCLAGADDDRLQGWIEYVNAVCDAAGVPSFAPTGVRALTEFEAAVEELAGGIGFPGMCG